MAKVVHIVTQLVVALGIEDDDGDLVLDSTFNATLRKHTPVGYAELQKLVDEKKAEFLAKYEETHKPEVDHSENDE